QAQRTGTVDAVVRLACLVPVGTGHRFHVGPQVAGNRGGTPPSIHLDVAELGGQVIGLGEDLRWDACRRDGPAPANRGRADLGGVPDLEISGPGALPFGGKAFLGYPRDRRDAEETEDLLR